VANRSSGRACVVGSGPNGLSGAIELARAGFKTILIEANSHIGGGIHSAELTIPGFLHDVCSAVHPLAVSSPAFQSYPLLEHGLQWIQPPLPLAHPLDDGSAGILDRSIEVTSKHLGGEPGYERVAKFFVKRWKSLSSDILSSSIPLQHPFRMARFGVHALPPASWEARGIFDSVAGRALFAGLAAHSALPLLYPGSSAFGWVLCLAGHAGGWPIPKGGSQSIANALASYFKSLGGEIVTGTRIQSLHELGPSDITLCDIGPKGLLSLAGDRLPKSYAQALERYRYGPAAFKLDWALSGPVPWRNTDCSRAGTVHLGGKLEEIAASENAAWRGWASPPPFVLFVQSSLFDSSRAPADQHTGWAYCHVANGSKEDMTEKIEAQVERFAPGFRKLILARHVITPSAFQAMNPNYVGGDIVGGAQTLPQLAFRPTSHLYKTPLKGVYLCSASTPPGGGVHGMCGYRAARLALKHWG
jgi:phytoene dehydrogenase-like protein